MSASTSASTSDRRPPPLRSPSPRPRHGWAALPAAALLAACTTTIESSTSYTGSSSAQTLNLGGYAVEPSSYVYPQILTSLDKSARDTTASWLSISAFMSGTAPIASGGRNYYAWNGTINGINSAYWPSGGVARMRILFKDGTTYTPGVTFDDLGCLLENGSLTFEQRAVACAGHDSGTLHLVDGDPIHSSSRSYLSLRETPVVRFQGNVVSDPALNYYAAVDPQSTRTTLAAWKSVNGFSVGTGSLPGYEPVVTASYFNHGDLELGRYMNCVKKTANGAIACYVSNYGDPAVATPGPGNSPTAALAATIGRTANGLVATVAMEYRPNSATHRVTFFAFDATGARATAAVLDTQGAKNLPGACLSCHGGLFNSTTSAVSGAHFLPFDVDNFTYSTSAGFTLAAQQDAFRALNKLVLETGPTAGITEVVNGWYGNNLGSTGPDQDTSFVPPGWDGQEVVYQEVVKPYCRGCHLALADTAGRFVVDFNTSAELSSYNTTALNRICELYDMPHAQVTRKLFWQSPARGHLIGEYSWPTACN